MTAQQHVHVALKANPYDIAIGTRWLGQFGSMVRRRCPQVSRAFVIADANVDHCAQSVQDSLAAQRVRVDRLNVSPGEASKSVAMADHLWQQLLDLGADRTSWIIAVGGGVVGDLAGFVAATFARGVAFCQVPTTLLAQVDSSVGGKTGINLPTAKNMVGCFWQPELVFIDTDVLNSLPAREYLSGLAEVVKYGVIMDELFFARLEADVQALLDREAATLRRTVARCCRLKADIVEADERETSGRRAILNYGHTFAHALEAVAGYGQLLHGEAVAIGMIAASHLAYRVGRIDAAAIDRQAALLSALRLPTTLPDLEVDRLCEAMTRDKKVEHGKLRFVLPSGVGHVDLVGDVAESDVRAAWEAVHA